MATPRSHAQAQWLIGQYLDVLDAQATPSSGRLSLVEHGEQRGRALPRRSWINVPLLRDEESEEQTAARARHARALVEVVAQLSHTPAFKWVDFYDAFWKHALLAKLRTHESGSWGEERPGTEYDCFEQLEKTSAPRFMLDFSGCSWFWKRKLETLCDFFFADPARVLDGLHRRVLSELLQGDKIVVGANGSSPPRVEIGINLSASESSILHKLHGVLKGVLSHGKSVHASVAFDVTSIWIPESALSDVATIDALANIVASQKLKIRSLYFEADGSFTTINKTEQAFQALLYRALAVKSLSDSLPCLRMLHLKGFPLDNRHAAWVCSALRSSAQLKEISLGTFGGDSVVWAWIAFGIFHPDSEARLDCFNVNEPSPIREKDMHVFRNILSAPNPGRELWELEHGELPTSDGFEEVPVPPSTRLFVRVSIKTAIRSRPKLQSQLLVLDALDTDDFEVAILLVKWTCIVVPGYGLGWILSSSILSQRQKPSRCATAASEESNDASSLRVLSGANVKIFERTRIGRSVEMTGVLTLLQMIGHSLEGLNVLCHRLHDHDLRSILSSCPNLTRLSVVSNWISDISALVDRYRVNECKIEHLAIRSLRVSAEIASQLAEFLAQPFTKPLRYVNADGPETTKLLGKLALALQVNCTLRFLCLSTSISGGQEEYVTAIRSAFENTTHRKADSRMKVAFLSAIQHDGGTSSTSLKLLDSGIVSIVFSFASISIPRSFVWNRLPH